MRVDKENKIPRLLLQCYLGIQLLLTGKACNRKRKHEVLVTLLGQMKC